MDLRKVIGTSENDANITRLLGWHRGCRTVARHNNLVKLDDLASFAEVELSRTLEHYNPTDITFFKNWFIQGFNQCYKEKLNN
jgi:hypothetical protein